MSDLKHIGKEKLTTAMHSEFTIDFETEISHGVSIVVNDLNEGYDTLENLLSDYFKLIYLRFLQ